MRAVIAVNNLGYIGKDNTLLWKCTEDLQHFKRLTTGGKLLVGYNTYSTLPPLKNREIFLYNRDDDREILILECNWCIGGKKTYEKYCHLFTELHISHINNNDIGNVTFPNLTNLNPKCIITNYYF